MCFSNLIVYLGVYLETKSSCQIAAEVCDLVTGVCVQILASLLSKAISRGKPRFAELVKFLFSA